MKYIDLTGQKFNRLTVIARKLPRVRSTQWICLCDCGNTSVVEGYMLRTNSVKSCGCYANEVRGVATKTHGLRKNRLYTVWFSMMQRCSNPNNKSYKDYGARGITVCSEWHEFYRFFVDMGEAPLGTLLDRIDNDKGYSKENCRWATRAQQNRNKRSTRLSAAIVEQIRASTASCVSLARLYGVHESTISDARRGKTWT